MKLPNSFNNFVDLTIKLSKLNKSFLSCIEDRLSFNGIYEVTAIQSLILKNIGADKLNLSKASTKGYYLGKNISYNVASLLKKGYLTKQEKESDRRCVYLVLTEKGTQVLNVINNELSIQQKSLTKIGVGDNSIENINGIIDKLQIVLDRKIKRI